MLSTLDGISGVTGRIDQRRHNTCAVLKTHQFSNVFSHPRRGRGVIGKVLCLLVKERNTYKDFRYFNVAKDLFGGKNEVAWMHICCMQRESAKLPSTFWHFMFIATETYLHFLKLTFPFFVAYRQVETLYWSRMHVTCMYVSLIITL